ncbi:MAG: hypothetical protein M3279_04335 [Actinomycetota bacterium]|nr:hypothetical protein [Actinomycetota bacterium]
MAARTGTLVIAVALLLGTVPAGAQEQPPPAVPEVVQIEDPAGDANYLNGQGRGLIEGDRPTPADLTVSDVLKVWFTHDAANISVHIQTEGPPPSSNAAYVYRVLANPGGDFPRGCLWWEAYVEGPTYVGEPVALLRDQCQDADPVEGTLAVTTLDDETGLITVTFPRSSNAAFADGGIIAAPFVEVRNVTGGEGAGPATTPVVDDTKIGTDYTITAAEDDKPKKKKKKKKA